MKRFFVRFKSTSAIWIERFDLDRNRMFLNRRHYQWFGSELASFFNDKIDSFSTTSSNKGEVSSHNLPPQNKGNCKLPWNTLNGTHAVDPLLSFNRKIAHNSLISCQVVLSDSRSIQFHHYELSTLIWFNIGLTLLFINLLIINLLVMSNSKVAKLL